MLVMGLVIWVVVIGVGGVGVVADAAGGSAEATRENDQIATGELQD